MEEKKKISGSILTRFLVRKFVKDYEEVTNAKVRTSYGVLGSVVGMVCNLALFILKLVIGLSVRSMAVTADAFNNLSDMSSSIISMFGVRVTTKRSDSEHPFGHGRAEYISAMVIALAIIEVGLSFFKESVGKIANPEELHVNSAAVLLLLISVGVKVWLSFFNRSLGKSINSEVLKATSTDSLLDAVTTSVTIASLLVYALAGINIDGIAGLIVSVLVIWAGIGALKDTLSPLIGQKMDPGTEQKITEIVREDSSVLSTHDLVIHSYGATNSMATIHIEVSDKMTLNAAHKVADAAEKRVMQRLGIILVIHVDPVNLDDTRIQKIREQINRIVKILDSRLSFHDLQITFGDAENLISFDLVVPYEYTEKDEDRVMYQIFAFMHELDPRNQCVISIDRGAIEEVGKVFDGSGQKM